MKLSGKQETVLKKRCFRMFLAAVLCAVNLSPAAGIHTSSPVSAVARAEEVLVVVNKNEQINLIRQAVKNREPELTLRYNGNHQALYNDTNQVWSLLGSMKAADSPVSGDYIRFSVKSMKVSKEYNSSYATFHYEFSYLDTASEDKAVGDKVTSILKKLDVSSKSNYEKIKAIHDYIVKNASYDQTLSKYSAYDNLIGKSSVCQGYALLTYRMMNQAGIPCRIITGMGNGGSHAWNIVKLQGKWYNLDCTFDDPIVITPDGTTETVSYNYFLKSDAVFAKDHARDKEYSTASFYKKYPMTTKGFTESMDNGDKKITVPTAVKSIKLNKNAKVLKVGQKFTLKATVSPVKAVNANFVYKTSNAAVAKVTQKGVITAVSPGKASITVQSANGRKKVCTITVK